MAVVIVTGMLCAVVIGFITMMIGNAKNLILWESFLWGAVFSLVGLIYVATRRSAPDGARIAPALA